jgi:hypothetical protein
MLDLRLPSGLFFLITGILLAGYGIAGSPHAPLTDVNVNLYTGGVMMAFGAVLLLLAMRARKA